MKFLRLLLYFVLAIAAIQAAAAQSEQRLIVLVAGATGETGAWVVRQLVVQGISVRALVRDLDRAASELGTAPDFVVADVRNPETLAPAFEGVSHAVSVIGSRQRTGPNSFEFVDWEGNRNLIDAAKAASVAHFVLTTSGSAGTGDFNDPDVLRFGAGRIWKGKAEAHLRASGLSYTIVAPGGLRDYAGGEKDIIVKPRNAYRVGPIARADVARVIVECLFNTACAQKTITVINGDGPADQWPSRLRDLPIDTPQTIVKTTEQTEEDQP